MFKVSEVLVNGPPPLGPIGVPIRPGLTALYGRNGVGKTRLLQRTKSAMRCDGSGSLLVVQPTNAEALVERLRSAQHAWRSAAVVAPIDLGARELPWRAPGRTELDGALGDVIFERWVCSPTALTELDDGLARPSKESVVDEVVRHGLLLLSSSSRGRWDLEIAVGLGQDTVCLNALRKHVIDGWDAFVDSWPRPTANEDADRFAESMTDEFIAFAESMNALDFFTVFGGVPCGAAGYTWTGDIGDLESTDLWRFASSVDSLRVPSTAVRLTGWFPDEVLLRSAVQPEFLWEVVSDDHLVSVDDFTAATVHYIEEVRDEAHWSRQLLSDDPTPVVADPLITIAPGAEPCPSEWLTRHCSDLCNDINDLLAAMLPEPPVLEVTVSPPDRWLAGTVLHWSARDPSGVEVELAELSAAQQRLVCLAATVVMLRRLPHGPNYAPLVGHDYVPTRTEGHVGSVLLLDEPELGLHAVAEDRLVGALHEYAVRNGVAVIAATHSRSFLRDPRINLLEVYRDRAGTALVRSVEFPANADPDSLGVHRADLLQLYQVVLLVEGRHDELVLKEMLGEELARRRVLVVPLRGAANLKAVVDLQILTDTLEVPVVVLLDGTQTDTVDNLWNRLCRLPPDAPAAEVDGAVASALGGSPSDEERQVASLARRLVERSQLERFNVFGLEKLDVLDYLPASRLVPGAHSWAKLRQEHAADRSARPAKAAKQFKSWLSAEKGADFGDDAVVIAAAVADVPDEFLLLLARIDSVVDGWTR